MTPGAGTRSMQGKRPNPNPALPEVGEGRIEKRGDDCGRESNRTVCALKVRFYRMKIGKAAQNRRNSFLWDVR